MADKGTALIIGASRGLGLGLVETFCADGWNVVATVREQSRELEATGARYPNQLRIESADIVDADAIGKLRERISDTRFSVLFLVAGISRAVDRTVTDADERDFQDLMMVNAFGAMRAIEMLEHLVDDNGVIAAMTSGLASIERTTGYSPLYSASKAALNMLFSAFAARRPKDSRALLLVAPGWVRTDMGGTRAELGIEDSVRPMVNTLNDHLARPGLRFVDRFGQTLPW